MKEIFLDIGNMSDIHQIHNYIKDLFGFPDYYGMNLDALYDCLGNICEATEVTISFGTSPKDVKYHYDVRVLEVFKDAARHNENLIIRFWDGSC